MSEAKQSEEIQEGDLESRLEKLVENLHFPSETDAPIEVITFGDNKDIKTIISSESNADEASITELGFEDFFAMYGTVKDWQNDLQKEFAEKFGEALNLLKANVQNVKIFRAGDVRAALYIIGQASSKWVGMKTLVVET